MSKAKSMGQKIAMTSNEADALLAKKHLRKSWVSCRIQLMLVALGFFKCLGCGHVVVNCTGHERNKTCYKYRS